eukprot:CAMPEP_0117735490 /NCGR_PEP_ID=MMETSP0947-20121206/1339_1 /TAXON_ID=44440 /ORGANISM="Chattonella subsalsa, Strain CCMP2191" /LENGTH=124 /DNA_ID=CAMNT_0005550547 /DNA_START=772 /DNA_END=1146 /DNA_ORIENTATION=-
MNFKPIVKLFFGKCFQTPMLWKNFLSLRTTNMWLKMELFFLFIPLSQQVWMGCQNYNLTKLMVARSHADILSSADVMPNTTVHVPLCRNVCLSVRICDDLKPVQENSPVILNRNAHPQNAVANN